MHCVFGSLHVDANVHNSTTAHCSAPSHPPGTIKFYASSSAHEPKYVEDIVFAPGIEVNRVHPSSAPSSGNTVVEVIGSYFSPSRLACIFRSEVRSFVHMQPAEFQTSTRLLCQSPPATPNSESGLTVKDDLTGLETVGVRFLHSPSAVVNLIRPSSASWAGGETIVLLGSGFETGVRIAVKFGEQYATYVTRVSASKLSCVAPPQRKAHNVTVFVSTSTEAYVRSDKLFEYVTRFVSLEAVPSSGPVLGGTRIRIPAQPQEKIKDLSYRAVNCLRMYYKLVARFCTLRQLENV